MDPQFYAAAIPAVIILGLSKGGFVGLGNLAIPLMALVMSPVQAAAVLLPILLVQDAVGVLSFRRSWDGFNLAVLLPSAFVGIFLGYLLAAHVSDAGIAFSVGVISIIFGLRRLIVERRASGATALRPGIPFGLLCGVGAGFTSMIAHAGGPPFQIYVMPQRLPRDVLVLPSHGLPFRGLHARMDELVAHHAERLEETLAACRNPCTVMDLVEILFRRPLDAHQMAFAIGEAAAHLNHLERQGRLLRSAGADEVWHFTLG